MAVKPSPVSKPAGKGKKEEPLPPPEVLLPELEKDLRALQGAYEQYFSGLERVPPVAAADRLRHTLGRARRVRTRNTALKFRMETLWQRFLTYDRMWQRQLKELEEGRHRRDQRRARPGTPARPEGAAPPERAAASAPPRREGMPPERLERLFEALVTAKRRCQEDTSGLTLDGMRRSLDRQLPVLREKNGGRDVDFKVVIKAGKAVLKAVPK